MSADPGQDHPRVAKVPWTEQVLSLLGEWQKSAAISQDAHYAIATRLWRNDLMLGIPVVVLATVVGTSVFATLQEQVAAGWRIAAGIVSVLAAVLASIQTFLRFQERAEKHRAAAELWAAIRREIAQMLALHPEYVPEGTHPKEYLDRLRKRMGEVSQQSPEIGDKYWRMAEHKWTTAQQRFPTAPELEAAAVETESVPKAT